MENNLSSLFLLDQTVVSTGVSSRLIYEGSPCDAFPCWNGGTCIEHGGHMRNGSRHSVGNSSKGYSCHCRDKFDGKHCQNRKAESDDGDWCSPERRDCPSGMICVVGNFGTQCLSVEAIPASPVEYFLPLPPLLILFYGLFLIILLLLFCWAGNSSGFFLLLRRKDKRGKWKEPLLVDHRRGEYAPILEEDDEELAVEVNSGGAIEMGKLRRNWVQQPSGSDIKMFGHQYGHGHGHGQHLFSLSTDASAGQPNPFSADENSPSMAKMCMKERIHPNPSNNNEWVEHFNKL